MGEACSSQVVSKMTRDKSLIATREIPITHKEKVLLRGGYKTLEEVLQKPSGISVLGDFQNLAG